MIFNLKGRKHPDVLISESELDQAVSYLKNSPFSKASNDPVSWTKQRLVNQIRDAIGDNPKADDFHNIAPGVFILVNYFGVDFALANEKEVKFQIWLLIRAESSTEKFIKIR